MKVTAIRAGFLTSVQDLGRAGFRGFGVSAGGALDPYAFRVTNLLVGNDEPVAGLEITFGGLRLRFSDNRVVAWSGAEFSARVGSAPLSAGHAALVRAGEEFSIDAPVVGCRGWLAMSGGIDVPLVLGSRSTDLKAGFGGVDGRALRDGEEFFLRENSRRSTRLIDRLRATKIASWKPPHDWSTTARRDPILRCLRGRDAVRSAPAALDIFAREKFFVSPDSDRMGVRLDGPRLESDDVVLLSEAVAPGAVQLPPNGKPILLLNDCQTIGGYPKIAHVITVDLGIAGQLRAADSVRFREVSLAHAHRALFERERDFEQFRRGIESRLQ